MYQPGMFQVLGCTEQLCLAAVVWEIIRFSIIEEAP